MADQPGVDLKTRLQVLWNLQSSARECLAYVSSIAQAAGKLPEAIDANHIFSNMYIANARNAMLLTSHLLGDDRQSISATSTAEYAKTHLDEFVRYHAQNASKSNAERNQALLGLLETWLARFASDLVVDDIKHVRDWTLAHTDKRSVTRPQDIPNILFTEVRRVLGLTNEFLNDLLSKVEERQLESGETQLEPQIKNEILDTVGRLTVISEIFAEEIKSQGMGPALRRQWELKKLLEGEAE